MLTTNEVRNLAESLGADFFGVADISAVDEVTTPLPIAISVGVKLPHSIVDQLPEREKKSVSMIYRHHAYDIINQRLDHIASRISGFLELAGYTSFPVPASQIIDEENLLGVFSNKMAAHMAGLGWIGKSCLMVTPEAGPRVRWATVLTQAELETTGEQTKEKCGTCTECVDICPAQAFTGRPFNAGEHRDLRFDVHKCQTYLSELKEKMGVATCGMCLYICPHGRRASSALA